MWKKKSNKSFLKFPSLGSSAKTEQTTPSENGHDRDISHHEVLEKALYESEIRLNSLFTSIGAQIIFTDTKGKIMSANPMAAGVLGKQSTEMTGKFVSDIYHPQMAKMLTQFIKIIKTGRYGILEDVHLNYGKDSFWYQVNMKPVVEDNKITGIIIIMNDITDRKYAEAELLTLSNAIEQSPSPVVIFDSKSKIRYANFAFLAVCGCSEQEILNKSIDVFKMEIPSFNNPKKIFDYLLNNNTWIGEIKAISKTNENLTLKATFSRISEEITENTGFMLTLEDITEKVKSEKNELRNKENLLLLNEMATEVLSLDLHESIIDLTGRYIRKVIPNMFFLINQYDTHNDALRLMYHNIPKGIFSKALGIIGFKEDSLSNEPTPEVISLLQKGHFYEIQGGLYEFLFQKIPPYICEKVENMFHIEKIISKGISKEGKLYGSLILFKTGESYDFHPEWLIPFVNITALALEHQTLDLELVQAKNKAEEMNRIKSAFLANMSHELRTPLNGILGFSELIEGQSDDPSTKQFANVINKSGIRLLETFNTIIDLANLEARNVEINFFEEDGIQFLEQISHHLSPEAVTKGLEFNVELNTETCIGFQSWTLIEKVITQIIRNAIKFTDKGSITLSAKKIKENGKVNLIISIRDTGIGIPEEQKDIVFQEFRQVSEGMTRQFEGSGLGLTIARKYTEMLNGDLSFKSVTGEGTVFNLSFPVYQNEKEINNLSRLH